MRARKQKNEKSTYLGAALFTGGLLLLALALWQIVRASENGGGAGAIVLIVMELLAAGAALYFGVTMAFVKRDTQSEPFASQTQEAMRRLREEKRLLRGPRVVAIGGGTGLPSLLRGLKRYTSNITAVVTVADNGGGTGRLRHDMGIIAPGDIRNCILALAEAEPILHKLFAYRFHEGELQGQNFGNIYLAAMSEVSGGFMEAVRHTSNVLAVKGQVLPVTLESVELCAELCDGSRVLGESQIPNAAKHRHTGIERLYLDHECTAMPEVIEAIRQADLIVFGPGSLYTSVIANLLVGGVADAVRKSRACKVAVCNIMTQAGETDGYTLRDHAAALIKHAGRGCVTNIVYNNDQQVDNETLARYAAEGSYMVKNDVRACDKIGVRPFGYDVLRIHDGHVRHDSAALGAAVMDVYRQTRFTDSMILRRKPKA